MRIVLVEPSYPGNIGSVARVMKNTGLTDLALVNTENWDTTETRALAHGANDILDMATVYPNLSSAIETCTWVIGTTHRIGRKRNTIHDSDTLETEFKKRSSKHSIAAVFGREKDGLWQDELQLCNFLVRFPSAVKHPSYNLSHAVLLLTHQYFLIQERSLQNSISTKSPELATHNQREQLIHKMCVALDSIEFVHYNNNSNHFSNVLRRFLNKIELDVRDIRVILKICHKIEQFSRKR